MLSLFRATKSRAQEEFEADALAHLDALYAHALRLTKSAADAQDLVQETFVRALRFHDRFERGTNLKAWLLRIQFNAFVNKYRRHAKEHSVTEAISHEPAGEATLGRAAIRSLLDPHGDALRPMVAAEIESALAELPEEQRAVVLLADVEELSYKEIAEVIGCPIGTVMSRLHRARRSLQVRLADHARNLGLGADAGAERARPISLASYRNRSRS